MYSPTENPLSAYRRFRAQTAYIEHLRIQSGLLALAVIINILILYLLQTAGVWLLRGWFRRFPPVLLSSDAVNELFTIFLYLAAFLLPYLVYAHMVRFPYREIPHDPPYPPVLFACTGVALGVSLAGSVLTAMVASVFALFGLFSPPIPMHLPADSFAAFLFVINTVILPAFLEEFVNRGIILGSLRRFGDRLAVVVSAALFALLHRNMTQIPHAFLMGLALGFFVVKTHSLWTGIFIHLMNNLIVLLLAVGSLQMNDWRLALLELCRMFFYGGAAVMGLVYLLIVRKVDLSLRRLNSPVGEGKLWSGLLLNVPMVMLMLLFAWVIWLSFYH